MRGGFDDAPTVSSCSSHMRGGFDDAPTVSSCSSRSRRDSHDTTSDQSSSSPIGASSIRTALSPHVELQRELTAHAAAAAAAAGGCQFEPSSPSALMFGSDDDDDDERAQKHVLLVCSSFDPFVSYISLGDQAFHKADLAELLLDNPALFRWAVCADSHGPSAELEHWWQRQQKQQQQQQQQQQQHSHVANAEEIDDLPLGEFKHMVLHLLMRLQQRVSDVSWNVRVSIVCWHSLTEPLRKHLSPPVSMSSSSEAAWAANTQIAARAWSASGLHSDDFRVLHVRSGTHTRKTAYRGATRTASAKSQAAQSARSATSGDRFAFRFLDKFPANLAIDALYLPNLMWYSELAPQLQLQKALEQLLRDIGHKGRAASLYPPLVWDDLCEQKQLVHAAFADCMIPCTWVSLASPEEQHIGALAEQLWDAATRAPVPAGATQNVFMLKAAWGCCKKCVEQLKPTTQGKAAALAELSKRLTKCARTYHQRCFTMQPHFASLANREFRIWCVAADRVFEPSASVPLALSQRKRWLIASGVQSSFVAGSGSLCAEAVCPYNTPTFAVWQFVEDLFDRAHKAFFDRLLDEGMPGVRIDCFYCEETCRVLINEITSPADTTMFTQRHNLPLIKVVMYGLADGLFAGLA